MNTHNIPFSIFKKKITLNCTKSMSFLPGTQDRVLNNRGKRAISVRATEVLLYVIFRVHLSGHKTRGFEYGHRQRPGIDALSYVQF